MRVVRTAWWYALPMAAITLPTYLLIPPFAVIPAVLAGAILWFFRDPSRNPPPTGILAPADGRVSVVREEDGRLRVGTFMNVTDVHVNRAPVAGEVTKVTHRPGAHRPAFSKDSDRNERVTIRIEGAVTVDVHLIAGAFARRITPYVAVGDRLDRGERIGHIAFGSRADVVCPATVDRDALRVEKRGRVQAGESVLVDG